MIAIYARQSLDKKDSISIESQIEFCKKEFDESVEEYQVYADKGYSGKDTNRPNFERMMNDINAGLIKKVIVYKLDRFSRSLQDFVNIYAELEKNKVEFISCTEKFDTSSPIGKAMLEIAMSFAQLERRTIQQRVEDNYYQRGKKGFYLGGPIPYGFTKVKTTVNGIKTSKLVENPETMPIVKKMFEMYADTNMSLGKISDYLNSKSIPAANGGRWDSCKVSRILRSPLYVKADADVYSYYKNKGCIISNPPDDFIGTNGCFLYGKREASERKYTKVEKHVLSIGLHEGVIDSRRWLLVQYKLDSNRQIKNSGKGKHTWLSGIVKCGYCGYAVSVIKAGHGNKKYFNCRGKTNLKACKGHSIPINVDEVEEQIEKVLFEKVKELKKVNFSVQNENDAKVNEIKLRIIEIDNQIENLMEAIAAGVNKNAIKFINEKCDNLAYEKNLLLEELHKVTVSSSQNVSVKETIEYFNNWDNLDIEGKKSVCRWFINRVNIFDDEINIEWKVAPNH